MPAGYSSYQLHVILRYLMKKAAKSLNNDVFFVKSMNNYLYQ